MRIWVIQGRAAVPSVMVQASCQDAFWMHLSWVIRPSKRRPRTWWKCFSLGLRTSPIQSQRLGDVWTTVRLLSLWPAVEMDVWMAAKENRGWLNSSWGGWVCTPLQYLHQSFSHVSSKTAWCCLCNPSGSLLLDWRPSINEITWKSTKACSWSCISWSCIAFFIRSLPAARRSPHWHGRLPSLLCLQTLA